MSGFSFNVQERDVDLLLLGQFNLSSQFVAWFAGKTGVPDAVFDEAWHSVFADGGETDVLLYVRAPDGRVAIMIEDKIGAVMQPRQCERYHERGSAICASGASVRYQTVLCAPAVYLRSVPPTEKWDSKISFEEIAVWLAEQNSPEANWYARILNAASSKLGRARWADDKSNHAVDDQLALLKAAYQRFIVASYADLSASVQKGRDREYYIGGKGLPGGIRFKHSLFGGFVALIFERRWVEVGEIWLSSHLPEGGHIIRHGGELHVSLPAEVFDPELSFEEQQETARAALEKITVLKNIASQFVAETES